MKFENSTGNIIKDQEKLSFDFIPEELPNREEEMQKLFGLYRGIVSSNVSQNVLIYGPVGTGKTVTAKRFCMEFEQWSKKKDQNIDTVFVNCRKRKNNSSAMWKIVHHFDRGFPDRGFSVEEMMKIVKEKIEERNVHLFVVLDEVDPLIQKEGSDLIYLLSRFDEERLSPEGSVSMILVSQKNVFELLEESARSSFKRSNRIRFPRYTSDDLFPILKDRVEMAFHPGSIDDKKIQLISDIAGKEGDGKGDARFGIELLEKSALIGEMSGRNEIFTEDIRSAKGEIDPYFTESRLKKLNQQEKLILLASTRKLKEQAYTITGEVEELYKVLCEEYDTEKLGHTQFWKYLKSLSDEGLLGSKTTSENSGRTTKVSLSDITAEKLEKKLENLIEDG
ncbi:MAG: AAA family ATPase [Candidatus Thermoplasmatota archaeon]|nr:AAA family ATPase [Candidatus Thermoplasmatota archaeon]MBS3789394.1 AAA family ATPase [Candidatus Thermoplasmatota archaeon]